MVPNDPQPMLARLVRGCIAMAITARVPALVRAREPQQVRLYIALVSKLPREVTMKSSCLT